jgi:hypothetical protein
MVLASIRKFNNAVPFKPYEIRMASGEKYKVPHPDFVHISPKGSFVLFIDAEDCPHHLSTLLIESAAQRNGRPARKAAKRR